MPGSARLLPYPSRRALKQVFTKGLHYDFHNRESLETVKLREDFLGAAAALPPSLIAGGAGTAAAVLANEPNGAMRLACSSNGSSIYFSQQNVKGDQNPMIVARIKVDVITTFKIEVGMVDSNATAVLGATAKGMVNSLAAGAGSTLNTGASDGACVIVDSATGLSNPTWWRAVGALAGVTILSDPFTANTPAAIVAPVAATYQYVAMQIQRVNVAVELTDVVWWINGTFAARIKGGGPTPANQLRPFVIVWSASAARNLDVDLFEVTWDRDVTVT